MRNPTRHDLGWLPVTIKPNRRGAICDMQICICLKKYGAKLHHLTETTNIFAIFFVTLCIKLFLKHTPMLTYNNHMKRLVLPEYGRHIQNMLDHCLSIADREERTRCARSIVDAMSILFPGQGDPKAQRRKLWDHLAIMSNFELDVDLPLELVDRAQFDEKPEPVALGSGHALRKVYGCHLEMMVAEAAKMEPGEERDALVVLLANHMKKLRLSITPEGVDDEKVFEDLYEMTEGVINIAPGQMRLHEFNIVPVPGKKKKKK